MSTDLEEANKRKRLELEAAELELREAELVERKAELAEKAQRRELREKAAVTIVRLSVGGRHFECSRDTLGGSAYFHHRLESGGGFGADLRDEHGRLFIDGDADEFELLLKVLRGSVDPHALDATGRATLRKMADMYSFEGILQMLADGSYDATALSEQDARLREQALTIRKALELNTINAAATADDALIDVFAKRASFAYTGMPTSPEATLLYAENQGRQQRHRVGWTAPDPDDEDQGPPRATFKRDTFDCVVGREVVEPETIDQFRERLNLFAGPLLEGLDMSNLVIAGGSVLAALTLGDPNEEERVVGADGRASMKPAAAARAVWRDARQTSSDIDMFIVADSDEQAQAVYRRVLQHFATRIAAVQQLPDDEPEWPDLMGWDHLVSLKPPYKVCKQLLVVRTSKAVTFVAGYPQRHVQLILRRHKSTGDVVWNFDVDACQVAYDGEKVYATPAARRALTSGIIFADPMVASPSYELRLVKYSQRGFAVAVPGLDMSRVKSSLKEGIFTMKSGKLLPLRLTFKKSLAEQDSDDDANGLSEAEQRRQRAKRLERSVEHTRLPDYEVVETPITGLGKLVALSTLVWGTEPMQRPRMPYPPALLREGEVTSQAVCETAEQAPATAKSFLISTYKLDQAKRATRRPEKFEWRKETPPHWPPLKMQQKLFVDEEGFDSYNRGLQSMLRYKPGSTPEDSAEKICEAIVNDGMGVEKLYMVWDYIPDVTTAAPETPSVNDFKSRLHEARTGENNLVPWLNERLESTPTVELPQKLAFPAGDSTFERSGVESWFLKEDVY